MADSVTPNDDNVFLDNAAWAIRSTYHTVLKASPGAAIFGQDMLFDIPFIADWNKLEITGNTRQILIPHEKKTCHYKIDDKVLVIQDGILPQSTTPI